MKTLIAAINAKYIHTSLAARLLYLSAKGTDTDFREYVIKDSAENIADDIILSGCDTAAFCCYIWNISLVERVCRLLREKKGDIVILLGGPEVSFDAGHFIETCGADYVLEGEGEETFPRVLAALERGEIPDFPGVSRRGRISNMPQTCPIAAVEALGSPYNLKRDEKDKDKRVLYFETSRGCPHSCSYCLSSREEGLRFFDDEYLFTQLDIVCRSGAKTIKLLDRSFCASADHACKVLDYIFRHHTPGQQYQFEINADTMPRSVLEKIINGAPKGLLRFEIGVQSTYDKANAAVGRRQDFERLSRTVRALMDCGRVDLHLDLIAGLPYETFDRFKQSFDDVFAFRAKELQLGFLKLLRGTALRDGAEKTGYVYDAKPPYELLESPWLSREDMENIHTAEDMLEKYWNSGRFTKTMNAMLREEKSPFEMFLNLGCFYREEGYKTAGYQTDELFACLDAYTAGRYHRELMEDYFPLFKVRPKRWYEPSIKGKRKKDVLNMLAECCGIDRELLFRYTLLEELETEYMLVYYKDMTCRIEYYDKNFQG